MGKGRRVRAARAQKEERPLGANTAAFSRPGGFDVACATVCHTCNGRSFLHMLSQSKMNAAFARHAEHAAAGDQAARP